MIQIENLNNQGFEEILETAKKQITQLSDSEWTNTQESDPGITLLELFAWLKVIQQNYINKVSNISQYKFLEMLDIHLNYNSGSKALIKVSNVKKDMVLPKGTKWVAGNMDFENDIPEPVIYSEIVGADLFSTDSMIKVKNSDFNKERTFYLFGKDLEETKERFFDINFSAPIKEGTEFNIYFDIALDDVYKRNPVSQEDNFYEMAKLNWQFYGEKNGVLGWHDVDVIKDETHNLLFSGIVRILMTGNMKMIDRSFKIRVKILEEEYDFSPRIRSIKNNVFEVTQKSTLCEPYIINKSMMDKDGNFSIYSNLAIYGNHIAFVKKDGAWKPIKTLKCSKLIKENKAVFSINNTVMKQIIDYTDIEDAILIIAYDKSIEKNMILGSGKGMSYQNIKLKYNDILYDSFDIMVGNSVNNQILFDRWNKVTNLFSSNKNSKDYRFIPQRNLIIFGDNEKGLAPRRLDNNIILMSLAITKGRLSNIKSGVIGGAVSKNELIKELTVEHLTDAIGGKDSEKFDDVKSKAIDILNTGKHLVTVDDYEQAVKATPGLVINSVKVLPNCLNNKKSPNCVTIVVRGGDKNSEKPLKKYEQNIKKYLDKYRIINTKIDVINPTYIDLSISGQVVVNSYYRKNKDIITQSVIDFVEQLNTNCGQTLYYGDLFGMIDKLDCVSYLDELHISATGENVSKTMSDDILIPPNGIYKIKSIDLNYVSSSNI